MFNNLKYISSLLIIFNIINCYYAEDRNTFPKNFQFGAASGAYQIEGAWNVSKKSESIWDYATHNTPEKIIDRSNGDIACDSYHKIDEDIESLKLLNVDYYSFSISWPRLLPNGDETFVNPDGVRYYNELIDKLIENNISPVVTLYHWDLHQVFILAGGFVNPTIIRDFVEYGRIAFELFGDRVKHWVTMNEPFSICGLSYEYNSLAPFQHVPGLFAYPCAHHLLLAHAKVYQLYKKHFFKEQHGKVGFAVGSPWYLPNTDSKKDIEAVDRVLQMNLDWFLHPIFSEEGGYPKLMRDRIAAFSKAQNFNNVSRLPEFTKEQKKLLRNSADFLGLNHYSTLLVTDADGKADEQPSYENDIGAKTGPLRTGNETAYGLAKVYPEGIRHILNYIKDKYDNPVVYITGNGYAGFANETTEDDARIWYHKAYLKEVLKAIHEDNCNVEKYSVWSLMDSFEWSDGYTLRFGAFYVDFNDPDRTRVPKKSADELSRIFKTHRLN